MISFLVKLVVFSLIVFAVWKLGEFFWSTISKDRKKNKKEIN